MNTPAPYPPTPGGLSTDLDEERRRMAAIEERLYADAAKGDVDAIKQLEELRRNRLFDNLVNDMDAYE
ncbi:MAG: hypothetical protein Q4D56_14245 [Bacteroides sp.]|nr:hypothetical protein [Bacteroides sp.]